MTVIPVNSSQFKAVVEAFWSGQAKYSVSGSSSSPAVRTFEYKNIKFVEVTASDSE